jgi:protease I
MLASSGIARGRRLTCVANIKDDVINAGANYVDEPVVRDGNLITSRLPGDLPDFCREIVAYLREAPRRRNNPQMLQPAGGHMASASYANPVKAIMGTRGRASANYMALVVSEEPAK